MTMTDDIETRAGSPEAAPTEHRGVAVVRSEPRVYGPGSNNSYFQDVALAGRLNEPRSSEAHDRLRTYAGELDTEMRDFRSAEGQRARLVVQEARRAGQREVRDGATSVTLAGFTTPQYLVDKWAAFRSPAKAFTDQTTLLPLAPFGLQVNLPSFTGPANVAAQTELQGAPTDDPAGSNLEATLELLAGYVDISQQLYDRGGMAGLAFDVITLKQIKEQLDASVDSYVLSQALAGAGTVTDDSAFSYVDFLSDVAQGREQLADTQGTRLLATHLFTTTDMFGFLSHQVDSQNRPMLTPDSSAIVMAQQMGDPKWNSWTGVHLGQARMHTDDNIPANGSNTQLIVARPQETYSFIGDEMSYTFEQTSANTLTVNVGLRCYVAAITRFPKSIAILTGTAYPTSAV